MVVKSNKCRDLKYNKVGKILALYISELAFILHIKYDPPSSPGVLQGMGLKQK